MHLDLKPGMTMTSGIYGPLRRGMQSNNRSELEGIIKGLIFCKEKTVGPIRVFTDSQ